MGEQSPCFPQMDACLGHSLITQWRAIDFVSFLAPSPKQRDALKLFFYVAAGARVCARQHVVLVFIMPTLQVKDELFYAMLNLFFCISIEASSFCDCS